MFSKSITALVTPFRNQKVDKEAFVECIERQISSGSSALVPVGTTGESTTLDHDEHKEVVSLCIEVVAGRVPIIAGAGSNSTAEAIELVAHARAAGADAALSVCPYYNRPAQEGLYAHFRALNDAVSFPVFVYNVPARTSSDITPETLGRLARLPNIIGVKDASAELDRVARHRALCGEDFILLSGEDATALAFNAAGGQGCISVTANVAPKQCAMMQAACMRGDYEQARKLDADLVLLHQALFCEPNPGPAKYALSELGLCAPEVRLPLLPVTAKPSCERIRSAMIEAGLLTPDGAGSGK